MFYDWQKQFFENGAVAIKSECIRPGTFLSMDDAIRLVKGYVRHYNCFEPAGNGMTPVSS
jgi:hypothetical protein